MTIPTWLRAPAFRRLLSTRLASQAADGVFEAALAGYVLFSPDRAADAGTIAVGLAVVLLPFSVVGPFVGVVLDRVDRRRTLISCGLIRALLALLAAGALAVGGGSAALVVLAIALLAGSRLVLSGVSAALPLAVEAPDLVAAGGFSTTAGTAATAAGAGVGAGVRALAGAADSGLAVVALAAAAAYAVSALVSRSAPAGSWGPVLAEPGGHAPAGWAADLRRAVTDVVAGARQLAAGRAARDALIAVNGGRIGYGIVFVSTLLLMRGAHGTVVSLGGVVAGLAVGTLVGAAVAPRLARSLGRPTVVSLGLVLGGLTAAAAAPVGSRLLLVAASPVLGFAQQVSKVSSDALIQVEVDDENRGRAFTIVDMAFSVTYVGAATIAAAVVPDNGRAPAALLIAGLSWCAAGALHAACVHRRSRARRPL